MSVLIKPPEREALNKSEITEKLVQAHSCLGELKGSIKTIPNENILQMQTH